jgi:hypothetical protein
MTPTPLQETGAGSEAGAPPNSLVRLLLYFGLFVVILVGVVAAYSTGLLDKIFRHSPLVPRKPVPVLLTDAFASLAITPPNWLRRWAYLAGLNPIERSFSVVYQSLRRLGAKTSPAQTPAEAADALIEYLPEVADETRFLLQEYHHALFSQKNAHPNIARHAEKLIGRHTLRIVIRRWVTAFRTAFLRMVSRKQN